jgi:LysR family transcriptional regulator, transcriptional activator of the cysJI operon
MDIKQLESFLAISKLKSFSKAAEKLYLTQPTISSHIQSLENELGTLLFNRLNKTVTLTSAGEILYEYAVTIVNKKESAIFALSEYKGKIEGVLEIASSSIPEQYFLVDLICEFNKKYPLVRYVLHKYDTGEVLGKLTGGDIDFGIVGSKKEVSNIEYIDILDDELVLIASKNFLKNGSNVMTLQNLMSHPFIIREKNSGSRSAVEDAFKKNGISHDDLSVVAEVEDNEALKKFVKNGMGISFISRKAIEKEISSSDLVIINIRDFEIKRKFYFAYHRKRLLSPLTVAFKDFLVERLAQY